MSQGCFKAETHGWKQDVPNQGFLRKGTGNAVRKQSPGKDETSAVVKQRTDLAPAARGIYAGWGLALCKKVTQVRRVSEYGT